MIHINYNLTKKEYKKYYIEANMLYLTKICFFIVTLGMALSLLIGKIFKNESFLTAGGAMLVRYIPTLLLCMVLSAFISLYELKKIEKTHPEMMEGSFKIRFEKKFMICQINGQNNKFSYEQYRTYRGFSNAILLQHLTEKTHIIVPKGLLTKEQIKTINADMRG